jgi:hypothetical protein
MVWCSPGGAGGDGGGPARVGGAAAGSRGSGTRSAAALGPRTSSSAAGQSSPLATVLPGAARRRCLRRGLRREKDRGG